MITVVRAGPLTTIQDQGRPGYAHLGVPRSGALDQRALRHANTLVGNSSTAAGLETTLLGCALRFDEPARVAVAGAPADVKVDKVLTSARVIEVGAGSVLDVGRAARGVRSYVAVAGGIDIEPVLGSRSTDTLSGLGPPKLANGMALPIGSSSALFVADSPGDIVDQLTLGVWLGPRDDWFSGRELFENEYQVSPMSNRVGCRLTGAALTRGVPGELASEGVVLGAIQVPADGQPLIFLADHPTTGGYPVIGVVDDVTPLAQARPGSTVRFRELH
ncbi:biotin-dependent carboxyltransferase family protein [Actinoplanes sp. TRM 88003]|uniref:Biotin-dependent carboxyltransferase family protein n=1 Tax=Paractinoplanes aksuensis TaxID=2939490 RepID=A0ABT1E2M3_9ACTN|nr:biotin-dependent carboxyltransferase family protein [Actinoplanes aksuensis]MCO8276486.1 biotin-dependent carboxyltransferase family protein [Actinoplanes aksuensis]